ncbi:TonB-dependent receptor plug domain-containing protein [Acinetobacter sp. CWB-B33]|uniref:TonB-dependent receptor plug domain-containing protein n=1 Tax=Acinetobacter sp. CWB-B33 TaxID=2815724 RepID=UPI0031FF362F
MRFAHSPLALAIFSALCPIAYANDAENAAVQPEVKLNTIIVEAEKANEVGQTTYSKEDLEKTPNSSKNITDFLKVNPNVQFDSSARSGRQQGELNPSEISINGGLPYDNKFLINGMSINNNINPASEAGSTNVSELMGGSQTVAINTDLLCKLTVLDSNVSAEYGEFTGGVVSAETCTPKTEIGKIHGKISYDYTSDSWSKIHFPTQEQADNFEDSVSEAIQPFFTKQGMSATAYGRLSETLGMNAFGSYRKSDIPLKTSISTPTNFDQKRESTNAGLELFYTPDDKTSLKIGTQFMESESRYFLATTANSESQHTSDSQNFYINYNKALNKVQFEQQLSYQIQTASREGEKDNLSWLKSSTKNWRASGTQIEGSFGTMEQQEEKLEYTAKAVFDPIRIGAFSHAFKAGAGYGHYNAYWERPETTYLYSGAVGKLKNLNCYAASGTRFDACDEGDSTDGQYLANRTAYFAGKIEVQQDRWHAFAEDQIQWDKYLTATLGLRTDYDSLTKNNNIAPRSSFVYKPFGNDNLYFSTGWNRYYGLNAFYNELQDRKGLMMVSQNRTDLSNNWKDKSSTASYTYRSQLDTPYADETVFAVNGTYANTLMGLKWVNRKNKDQLRRTESLIDPRIDSTRSTYTYDNTGHSESDIFSLSISNIEPLQFLGSQHKFSFNADYTQTERNFNSYSSTFYIGTPQIYYDGKIINAEDRPSEAFNTPWTTRLGWDIQFDNLPLSINNFISYQGKVDAMKKTTKGYTDENGIEYDMYTPYTTKNKFYWDLRATYDISMANGSKTTFGLTVNNVTDRKNTYISSGVIYPELGRQFIADVTFKF